jgi:hypothetical protein
MPGVPPRIFPFGIVLFATILTFAGIFLFVARLVALPVKRSAPKAGTSPSLFALAVILLPFAGAYLVLLIARAATTEINDRYVFAILIVTLVFIVRFYQDRVADNLPLRGFAVVAAFAMVGVAGMHDLFAMERARLELIDELHHSGLSDTDFYGGYEYDGWTQLKKGGYINSHRIVNPPNAFHDPGPFIASHPCGYAYSHLYPVIQPRYIVSYEPAICDGPTTFKPVVFHTWLPPFRQSLYVNQIHNPTLQPSIP